MTEFRERLWASPAMFLATALLIPASLLVFLPISLVAGIVAAVVLYGGSVLLLVATSPVVGVSDGRFTAGRASIPLEFVGTPSAYRGRDAFEQRGRLLDARAWLLLRGWVDPVVKVPVLDVDDPAPYWLVSTRRPESLMAAITEGHRTAGPTAR